LLARKDHKKARLFSPKVLLKIENTFKNILPFWRQFKYCSILREDNISIEEL